MVEVDLTCARNLITDEEFKIAKTKAEISLEEIRNKTGEGAEWLGWRDLLSDPNDAILEQIESLSAKIRSNADVFVVCGIGGSYLGARAVIEALGPHFIPNGPEIIYAGHHMGGKYLEQLISYLEKPKADGTPKSVYLNVISKSGSTLETALSFRILRQWIHTHHENDAVERIICTTSKEGGVLNKLIEAQGYQKFVIPADIGGRYSVLTPVGLIPIAVAGIDIKTLFYGAVNAYNHFEANPENVLSYAAIRYILHQKEKAIDVFSSFEPELKSIGAWIQQLMGESEGKKDKGIFPTVATYSTDLHSLGQFIQQGKRSLIETIISVEKPFSSLQVNNMPDNDDQLNYLAGMKFHDINKKAREGTVEAHVNGGVPVIRVKLPALHAGTVGELIYFYELLTGVYVYCLEINPFNQPGVEDYKKAMYRLLGKK